MGLLDFEFGSDSGNSSSSDDWYSDDVWDDVYDDSFSLSGTTDNDSSFWSDLWDKANTPLGTGIIGGAASGLSQYYSDKSREDMFDKSLNLSEKSLSDKINTREAHNASINQPYSGAKQVRYNGVEIPDKEKPMSKTLASVRKMFKDKVK